MEWRKKVKEWDTDLFDVKEILDSERDSVSMNRAIIINGSIIGYVGSNCKGHWFGLFREVVERQRMDWRII